MTRPSIALAVLVLALSAVAVAGAAVQQETSAATPVVDATPGEPNHLAINESDVRRSNATSVDLDVGSAIAADSSAIRSNYFAARFEAAYENASTEEARSRVVGRFVAQLRNATATLEARDRANIEAYASGSIATERFLRERARIQRQADRLQQAGTRIRSMLPRDYWNRFNGVDGRLEVLQGPVSAATMNDLTDGDSGEPIYVEVSGSGYTMARIADGEYTRETSLYDAREPVQPDQFANGTSGLVAAQNRAMDLYPWIRTNQENPNAASALGPGIYRVTKGFPGGEVRLYLSGGTTEIFREHQTRTLESFNTTEAVNRTDGGVRLTVNRTYETGPAEIRLYDTTTDAPLNGTVTIGNRDPVWVGDDGRLWIVEPRENVQLNATVGTTEFSTSLSGG